LRVVPALLTLLVVGAVASGSPASAASGCPTQTFLSYNHLAYEATGIPAAVTVPAGSGLGGGTVDEPTTTNGCHRVQRSVHVLVAGSIDSRVAVLVRGRPRTLFVIGHRCQGFAGSSYWDCLLHPLVFDGQTFTGASYPSAPPPRKTVAFGGPIGRAQYQGRTVTVRRIQGVAPAVAVGIPGQPSAAFLSPRACPYSGFSNTPQYDVLLRCLRSPVWFTFDPPGSQADATVVARSDRAVSAPVAGASISLVRIPVVADFVPAHPGGLVPVGQVAAQVSLHIPNLPSGLYEAVVSCPRCGSLAGGPPGLFPSGSILVTAKPKSSVAFKFISYALAVAFITAAILAFRTWRRRQRLKAAGPGPGPAGS
jgi:hypothetical protein